MYPVPAGSLPEYNRGSVVEQLAAPFLVASQSISERSLGSGDASTLAELKFCNASQLWLESQKPSLRERTFYMYRHHLAQLAKYFGDMKLNKIHVGHLDDYQKARVENRGGMWQKTCGASIINHEMSMMQQVLKRAKLWAPLEELYNALPLPASQKKKVLDDIEERRFFAIAASRPEWELAALVVTITRNTTAAGSELRNLRFQDVILDAGLPRIVINGDTAKNAYRGRVICLNETARDAIERCIVLARKKGSSRPEHYLFPKRVVQGLWDSYAPASPSWLAKPFDELRRAVGIPWLTLHCFRHMAITVMLEKGAAPETVRHIAGHVSEEMMRHYSHNRHATQVAVLQALDSAPKPTAKRPATLRAQRQFVVRGAPTLHYTTNSRVKITNERFTRPSSEGLNLLGTKFD